MRSCAFAFLTMGALATSVGPMRVVKGQCHKCGDETFVGEVTVCDFNGKVTVRQTKCGPCYS